MKPGAGFGGETVDAGFHENSGGATVDAGFHEDAGGATVDDEGFHGNSGGAYVDFGDLPEEKSLSGGCIIDLGHDEEEEEEQKT